MAIPPNEPQTVDLNELAKEVPAPETAVEGGNTDVAPGQLVRPLPTPGTVPGGVIDAGDKLAGAGVEQSSDQTRGLSPELHDLYTRLWGRVWDGSNMAPAVEPTEDTPAPPAPSPDVEPDL